MFGAFLDAAMSIPRNMQMEEDRNQRQQWGYGQDTRSYDFNSAQALEQRNWAERMANTQHQRGVADMRAAGLNPILSVRQGGASVGSGATASGSGSSGGVGGTPGSASSNFAQGEVNSAQAKLLKSQEMVADQQAYNVSADTEMKKQNTNLLMEQQHTEKARRIRTEHEAEITGNTAKGSQLEGEIDSTKYGEIMRYIDRSIRSITGTSSAYGRFKNE